MEINSKARLSAAPAPQDAKSIIAKLGLQRVTSASGSDPFSSLGVVIPDAFEGMPVDLYLLGLMFTEYSPRNPKVYATVCAHLPRLAVKYKLCHGGLLYRGQPIKDDASHTVEMLKGVNARSWSTDKQHAAAFVLSDSDALFVAQVPDSKVVLNVNSLVSLIRVKWPRYYAKYLTHVEDEVLVDPSVIGKQVEG
jgi:hypothetical protein